MGLIEFGAVTVALFFALVATSGEEQPDIQAKIWNAYLIFALFMFGFTIPGTVRFLDGIAHVIGGVM